MMATMFVRKRVEHCAPPLEELDRPSLPAGKVAVKEQLLSSIQRTPFAKLSSGGAGRKGRSQRFTEVRAALDHAKGDMGGAEDVLHLLEGVLHEEEWDLLAKRVVDKAQHAEASAAAWPVFGQACAKMLQQYAGGKWRWPLLVTAVAAKQVGCKSRRRMKQVFGFQVSRSVWRLADDEGSCLSDRSNLRNNGRLGYRKIDPAVVVRILQSNSEETCKFGVREHWAMMLAKALIKSEAWHPRPLPSTRPWMSFSAAFIRAPSIGM